MKCIVDGVEIWLAGRHPQYAKDSSPYLLIHLLAGSGQVRASGAWVTAAGNFLTLPTTPAQAGATVYAAYATDFSVSGGAGSFIARSRADNRLLFRAILLEVSHFILHEARRDHTSAFVFLYRMLERICYSAPLLYCRTHREYESTFTELRSMFANADKAFGEIAFLKKLLAQGNFIDHAVLSTPLDISFASSGPNAAAQFQAVTTRYSTLFNAGSFPISTSVKFEFLVGIDLLASIRNHFFHALTGSGRSNIAIADIGSPDAFFSCVNPPLFNVIARILAQLVAVTYRA